MAYSYRFDVNKCWYLGYCKMQETAECGPTCIRYMEMDYLMFMSNLPLRRQYPNQLFASKEDIDSFVRLKEVGDNIVDFVDNGENLYIYSDNFGNGKTSWSIRLMLKYFNKVWLGNGFKRRGIFIHVPTFMTLLKQSISKKDPYFEKLKEDLMMVDIVVWDDIAATKLSDYDHTNLLTYIDQRVFNYKSNIYTGNLGESAVINALGNRLASRVWNQSEKVRFVGYDRRGVK